jgi:hypothetical protein
MNANELADELERVYSETKEDERIITEATTMLRQQQAEIEALKQLLEAYRDDNRK